MLLKMKVDAFGDGARKTSAVGSVFFLRPPKA